MADKSSQQHVPLEPVELNHDFSGDRLKPKEVIKHLDAHDERMRTQSHYWALAKAMYTTDYWNYQRGRGSNGSSGEAGWKNWVDVEVNRIFPIVGSYLAALYPRAQRSIVSADPASLDGDPEKAQLVNNRWLASNRINQRIMSGIRQAIMYPGCGAKIGYSPGRGNPMDRVWFRTIPWWEMVLDVDVTDVEDQRFIGHVYYDVKEDVKERFGIRGDLKGSQREDFLERTGKGKGTKTNKKTENKTGKNSKAEADLDSFVRVLEVVNLQDMIEDDKGNLFRGRLEIYVLDQTNEFSKKPVFMGPLPFAKYDGSPMSHIMPLIFNHEPEFPLRGIPHSKRMLPQMQELNSYRAYMAMSTRKDTRQFIARKGAFDSDTLSQLTAGVEGAILEVQADFERPLQDAIIPVPQQQMNINIPNYMKYVENDLDRTVAQSPQARGEITKATAFEIQTVQQYSESEFGMHAAKKDDWLAEILHVFLRAVQAAMQDDGDYAGGYDDQKVALDTDSATPTGGDTEEEDVESGIESIVASDVTAGQEPLVEEGVASPPMGEHSIAPGATAFVQQTLRLKNQRKEIVEISVADLDAEFDISFVEGGRTPLTDAAMQQNLVALLPQYMQLWQMVQQGGPDAAFSRNYMQVLAERFDLPKDLHPSELENKTAEMGPPAQPEVAPGPEAGGPPQGGDLEATLQQILKLPPAEALSALSKLLGNNEEMQQMLAQVAQMPPDQQAAMIQEIVGQLLQSQGPPPEQAPPPETPVDQGAPQGGGPPGAPIPPPGPVPGV